MKKKSFYSLLILFLYVGTVSISSQNKTNSSKQIKNLIAKKRSFNKNYGFGFRVQIFYGDESKARKAQSKFKINFPGVDTKLIYKAPEWKVQVGNYKTKLEADKAIILISEKFEGVIAIPLGK
jgi:hypothetical protein